MQVSTYWWSFEAALPSEGELKEAVEATLLGSCASFIFAPFGVFTAVTEFPPPSFAF